MESAFRLCAILGFILLWSCSTPGHQTSPETIIANDEITQVRAVRPKQEIPDSRKSACREGEQEFEIRFASPQPVYSFNFKIKFDETVLRFRDAIGGDFLGKIEEDSPNIKEGEGNGRVIFFAHPEKEDQINVGLSLLGRVKGKKGEGTLATLCFQIVRPNTPSDFRIRDIRLTRSISSVLFYNSIVDKGGGISFLSRRVTASRFSERLSF